MAALQPSQKGALQPSQALQPVVTTSYWTPSWRRHVLTELESQFNNQVRGDKYEIGRNTTLHTFPLSALLLYRPSH